jgi:hypothetical protein
MVAVVVLLTGTVVTVVVVLVCPALMLTLLVILAALELLLNVTLAPPVGAGPERVTVAVAEVPPVTELGLMLTETVGGSMVRLVETEDPFAVAVMVATVEFVTEVVVMVAVPVLCPVPMVML